MYHEEKIENGYLFFRTTPTGEWRQWGYHMLLERVKATEAENAKLREAFGVLIIAARDAIDYVAATNYPERARAARKRLDDTAHELLKEQP